MLFVHWLGLCVIGLVFVVGWERGVVGNGVLDVLFIMVRMFLLSVMCLLAWDVMGLVCVVGLEFGVVGHVILECLFCFL